MRLSAGAQVSGWVHPLLGGMEQPRPCLEAVTRSGPALGAGRLLILQAAVVARSVPEDGKCSRALSRPAGTPHPIRCRTGPPRPLGAQALGTEHRSPMGFRLCDLQLVRKPVREGVSRSLCVL